MQLRAWNCACSYLHVILGLYGIIQACAQIWIADDLVPMGKPPRMAELMTPVVINNSEQLQQRREY